MIYHPRRARFVILAIVVSAGVTGSSQTRVMVKDRTTALVKALSAADAYHATLFDGLGQFQKPLDVLASVDVIDDYAQAGKTPLARDVLRTVACATDTAFAGVVTEAKSHPSQDGLFLWTSYTVRVTKPLRQRAAGKPPAGSVTVVRAGGSITLEGVTVEAKSNTFPPLVIGSEYYLLTSYLDRTGAYKNSNRDGTYQLDGASVKTVGVAIDDRLQSGIPATELEAALRNLTCGR